jgi:hypothetical protein
MLALLNNGKEHLISPRSTYFDIQKKTNRQLQEGIDRDLRKEKFSEYFLIFILK